MMMGFKGLNLDNRNSNNDVFYFSAVRCFLFYISSEKGSVNFLSSIYIYKLQLKIAYSVS